MASRLPVDAHTARRPGRPSLGVDSHAPREELVHALSHGAGAVFAVGALVLLLVQAAGGGWRAVLGASAFGGSLVLLYLASTLYHGMPARCARAKRALQQCDHAGIYLLIAGTYTPVILLGLPTWLGLTVLAVVWSLGALGLGLLLTPLGRGSRLQLGLYLGMGWLIVVALPDLVAALTASALVFLLLGGLAYTTGVAFYVMKRRWAHAVWHGFVLAGSGFHVAGVLELL